MEYTYVPPPLPTLARWRQIATAFRGMSVLRMLEYEHLSTLNLKGKVLDMGGGQKASYLKVLPLGAQIESANIDPGIEPTHLIEPGQALPFPDDSYDEVICFNTLEHIYDSAAVAKASAVRHRGGL